MKKIAQLFAAVAFFALLFGFSASDVQAQANNQNGYVGIAHSVPGIPQCINDARQAGWDVNSTVTPITINCLVPPCPQQYRVTFYGQFKCRPGQICPLAIILVATVVLDENGNVISAQCGSSPI